MPTRSLAVLLSVVVLLGAASTAVADAPAADPSLHDFEPNGEYVLVVDGKAAPDAEILRIDRLPAYLILSKALSTPVLLLPRDGTVAAVPPARIVRRADGVIDIQAGTTPAPLGKLVIEGDGAAFTEGGHQASLQAKPALVGLHTGLDLEQYNPSFRRRADRYVPSASAVAALRASKHRVTVHVIFGSWCPHCQQRVPGLLRLERELKGASIAIEYFGLPRPPAAWSDPESQRYGISSVPVAIVTVDGEELGRIISIAWDAPEVLLAKIVGLADRAR